MSSKQEEELAQVSEKIQEVKKHKKREETTEEGHKEKEGKVKIGQ